LRCYFLSSSLWTAESTWLCLQATRHCHYL
jgi:hypothetical protein